MRHPPHSVLLVSDGPVALVPSAVLPVFSARGATAACTVGHTVTSQWQSSSQGFEPINYRAADEQSRTDHDVRLNGTTCTVDANRAVALTDTAEALTAGIGTPGRKPQLGRGVRRFDHRQPSCPCRTSNARNSSDDPSLTSACDGTATRRASGSATLRAPSTPKAISREGRPHS